MHRRSREFLKNKKSLINSIDSKYEELTALSDKIWSYEEIAFQEVKSSQALAQYAEANGFRVERGVAEIPTALVAEYGSGKPIIGIWESLMPYLACLKKLFRPKTL